MELRHPLHLGVVAIEKGAFGSPSTKVANDSSNNNNNKNKKRVRNKNMS